MKISAELHQSLDLVRFLTKLDSLAIALLGIAEDWALFIVHPCDRLFITFCVVRQLSPFKIR